MKSTPFSFTAHSFKLVGILNVTPDSFSDGGNFLKCDQAVVQGLQLIEEGADLLDIGGESSRPGALPISPEEEKKRILPVISALRQKTIIPLSVDTYKPEVAEAALQAGASIINDITALKDPKMAPLITDYQAGVILMHMQGKPTTMQEKPTYLKDDVLTEVLLSLGQATKRALQAGIAPSSILLDPGIGFGKTVEHNLDLIRGIPQLKALGLPIMLGHSRKSFLTKIVPEPTNPKFPNNNLLTSSQKNFPNRLFPGIAVALAAYQFGATYFRVHEIRPYREALSVYEQLKK